MHVTPKKLSAVLKLEIFTAIKLPAALDIVTGKMCLGDDGSVRADASLPWFHFLPRLLQFTLRELFHCRSENTWEPVPRAAIKLLHCWSTWSRWHSCDSCLRSSHVPLLLLVRVCGTLLRRNQEYGFLPYEKFPPEFLMSSLVDHGMCANCARGMCSSDIP